MAAETNRLLQSLLNKNLVALEAKQSSVRGGTTPMEPCHQMDEANRAETKS
jgi:hypothetical protein